MIQSFLFLRASISISYGYPDYIIIYIYNHKLNTPALQLAGSESRNRKLQIHMDGYAVNQALAQVPEFRDPETETGNSKIDT